MADIEEKKLLKVNGFLVLALLIILLFFAGAGLGPKMSDGQGIFFGISMLIVIFVATGFFLIHPNESRVVTFFGKYIGSCDQPGFYCTLPFTGKTKVSLKVINFSTEALKVNDAKGSPIEIGAVVVWRVVNSAKAHFGVESYDDFVATQSETALRAMASDYPYDTRDDKSESLRGSPDVVAKSLRESLQSRLEVSGVEVIETRLSHLAYAQEIAQAMLKRQQAEAIIDARKYIVDNAVTMVEDVLNRFESDKVITLDDNQKVSLINNLLVALVSDKDAQPVITMDS